MEEAVVVGGGIMGATIAKALREVSGRSVKLIDGNFPLSGTRASGGSVKPSPLTGLDAEQLRPALDMLDRLYGLKKEEFVLRPSGGLLKADVFQIEMDKV